MAYTKQNFSDGNVLTAAELNHIEEGILQNEDAVKKKADLDESGKLKAEQLPSEALTEDDLNEAISTALTQAKESGEFDGDKGEKGEDGISATHEWNGTTLIVTSASGTSSADLKGDKGDKGETGVGISSVKQTTTSSADGGSNIITVTKTDGTTSTFTVKNGTKGSTGTTGAKGDKGDQGIQGEKGDKGDKGDTGAAGADGADGKDGTSVTVQSVSESTADGGSNIVTFSDGKTLTVKNGSKGSTGEKGDKGDTGATGAAGADGAKGDKGDKGETGVGISSVKQTTTSSADGGSNVITVTKTDGTTSTFAVKNGSKGSTGANGTNGKDGVSATHSWNGTTLTITSASGTSSANLKGDTGANGSNGKDGSNGTDGVGIKSVVQTTTSSADGGSNVITVTKTDNTTSTFTVKNGSKGSKGDKGDTGATGSKGADGYTPVKGVDYFTAADKAEIAQMVIESLGGNPIFGYVDENNNIIVQGNLADGSYSVKYEMENGSTVDIGDLILDTRNYYTVKNNLTNCTSNNNATGAVEGGSYSATITAKSGYELKTVAVTMGGSPVSVSGGNINIANVTGNIVITAVAEEIVVEPTNLLPQAIFNTSEDAASSDKGYVSGYKISTSGGGLSQVTGCYASGYIEVGINDTVTIENITLRSDGNANNIVLYSGTNKASKIIGKAGPTGGTFDSGVNVDNGVYSFTPSTWTTDASVAYFRFSCGGITDATIVTVTKA